MLSASTHIHTDDIILAATARLAIAFQMADVMQEIEGGRDSIDMEGWNLRGLTAAQVTENYDAALGILANRNALADGSARAAKRRARIEKARNTILCMMPSTREIVAELLTQKFKASEIDDFLHEAITLAADQFAADINGAPRSGRQW